MDEYIKRETLLQEVAMQKAASKASYPRCSFVVGDVISCIRAEPAADVAPVVHGKWENKKGSPVSCYWTKDMKYLMVQEEAYCSVCGEYLNASAEYTVEGTFCPHCGAKMDQRG